MSTYLRRSVDMGPRGIQSPNSDQDYRTGSNALFYSESKTRWARFWAFWRIMQPSPNYAPDHPDNPGRPHFEAFDAQVQLARQQGRNVILVIYEFPYWTNGTEQYVQPGVINTPTEVGFDKENRMRKEDWDNYYRNGAYNGPLPKRKALSFRRPTDLAPQGPWAQFVSFLINRYRNGPTSIAVEIMNEPNGQMWPLMNPSNTAGDPWANGDLQLDCDLATFMQSAQQISAGYGHPVMLMAPATDDGLGPATPYRGASSSTRLRVRYDTFTNGLLGRLETIQFQPHQGFLWSHHNYRDVEDDLGQFSNGPGLNYVNRAADVRSRLVNRWGGWPQTGGQKSDPYVFITEGGARKVAIQGNYGTSIDWKAKQKDLVKNNWQRNFQNGGNGAGIAMIANYLWYSDDSDPNWDVGLREPWAGGAGGGTRPSYEYWKTLPDMP